MADFNHITIEDLKEFKPKIHVAAIGKKRMWMVVDPIKRNIRFQVESGKGTISTCNTLEGAIEAFNEA